MTPWGICIVNRFTKATGEKALTMTDDRFPYETANPWTTATIEHKRQWYEALEDFGVENVRQTVIQHHGDDTLPITVGSITMTKGFAQRWIAWHDRKKAERENTFRRRQIFWTRWAAIVATAISLRIRAQLDESEFIGGSGET